MTVTEPQGLCTVTLSAGFAASATAGTYTGAGDRAVVSLTALQAGPDDTLDDVALPFVGTFVASVEGYQQTGVAREADNLRVDFTGRLGQPGKGTLYLRQFGPTVCAITFFVIDGTEITYEPTLAQLIASLRPVKGVG
jgi:hypothetical protein